MDMDLQWQTCESNPGRSIATVVQYVAAALTLNKMAEALPIPIWCRVPVYHALGLHSRLAAVHLHK